jgi:hypothetical protein
MTEFERGWAAAIEAAKHACDRERLGEERDPTDTAYDLAIDHCIGAISALQCPKQPAEAAKCIDSPYPEITGRTDRDIIRLCAAFLADMHNMSSEWTIDVSVWLLNEIDHALAEPAAQSAALDALLTRIDNAHEAFDRYGHVCEFEGEPMIYASTLSEIMELRAALAQQAERREQS